MRNKPKYTVSAILRRFRKCKTQSGGFKQASQPNNRSATVPDSLFKDHVRDKPVDFKLNCAHKACYNAADKQTQFDRQM